MLGCCKESTVSKALLPAPGLDWPQIGHPEAVGNDVIMLSMPTSDVTICAGHNWSQIGHPEAVGNDAITSLPPTSSVTICVGHSKPGLVATTRPTLVNGGHGVCVVAGKQFDHNPPLQIF